MLVLYQSIPIFSYHSWLFMRINEMVPSETEVSAYVKAFEMSIS